MLSFVDMESSQYESEDDMDAEQLATEHYTSAQQSGGGSMPATAKADQLAAERLRKKRHRAKETKACHAAAKLYTILCKVQPSSLRNCSNVKLAQL